MLSGDGRHSKKQRFPSTWPGDPNCRAENRPCLQKLSSRCRTSRRSRRSQAQTRHRGNIACAGYGRAGSEHPSPVMAFAPQVEVPGRTFSCCIPEGTVSCSSCGNTNRSRMRTPGGTQTPSRQVKRLTFLWSRAVSAQSTPSFFCRLEEEVVYWKVRRLSG